MKNYIINCSSCNKPCQLNYKSLPALLIKYNLNYIKELNTIYKCKKCKFYPPKSYSNLESLPQFIHIKNTLQSFVNNLVLSGFSIQNLNILQSNIHNFLSNLNIPHYSLIINNNLLLGVKLLKLPILNEIIIPLNPHGSSHIQEKIKKLTIRNNLNNTK